MWLARLIRLLFFILSHLFNIIHRFRSNFDSLNFVEIIILHVLILFDNLIENHIKFMHIFWRGLPLTLWRPWISLTSDRLTILKLNLTTIFLLFTIRITPLSTSQNYQNLLPLPCLVRTYDFIATITSQIISMDFRLK